MKYGYFDQKHREYVIDRVDLPTSWTNYLGLEDMAAVINHTAGGYSFYKSCEYHRITRFRANGVPMDRPGYYVYLRDNSDGDYWSVSWQPVGKDLDKAEYSCRHGLSYSVYECSYRDIHASQKMFIPLGDNVLLWDVEIENTGNEKKNLSVFSYLEFSFHQVMIDNQNFQMSMYCAGGSYADGIIEEDLYYEQNGFQYFTADVDPDGYDCVRDTFIGNYRTETDPEAVVSGRCSSSEEKGNNHCGALQKDIVLMPGEKKRIIFMLGEGNRDAGRSMRTKYSIHENVDAAFDEIKAYWDKKCGEQVIDTPNEGMNALINAWTLYQSEINVMFSRFASFIEVGGRVGLGYRDTAQDAMTIPHSNPEGCRKRIIQLMRGLTKRGYGLHLFEPEWFEPDNGKPEEQFKSPTVIPKPNRKDIVHGIEDACSDDALWLVPSVTGYIKETGDLAFADKQLTYADTFEADGSGATESVYEHMKRILDFSAEEVGADGICKGLRADWNDCLNLGGGESTLVSFLHYWALEEFVLLARTLGRNGDAAHYSEIAQHVKKISEDVMWDGEWYIRGVTKNGKKVGTHEDREGRVHLESNAWAILSGAAEGERAEKALESIDRYLFTPYGLLLNTPSYTVPNDDIGFVTRVYPGLKENGSVFSHPNPWAWAAACRLGRGDLAIKFYNALCPYYQNDKIEIRQSEPYSYCQFVVGKDHTAYGKARHPFMTGSGGWSYYSATHYILGVMPDYDELHVDPCIPSEWDGFTVKRMWRGAEYDISVRNPEHVMKGVREIKIDGQPADKIRPFASGEKHSIEVCMGR